MIEKYLEEIIQKLQGAEKQNVTNYLPRQRVALIEMELDSKILNIGVCKA